MRRSFAAGLAALTLLLLAGCGGSKASPSEVPEQPSEEPAPPEPTAEELAAREIETILSSLTLEEKVGQLFFVRCPAEHAIEDIGTYHLGGYLLFGRDYQDAAGSWLTEEQFVQTITAYQDAALADTGITPTYLLRKYFLK